MAFADRPKWIDEKIIALGERAGIPNYFSEIEDACADRVAQLFVDGRNFVVLKPERDQVWLWLAWSDTGNASEIYTDQLVSLAKIVGSNRIQFQTPFIGVVRLCRRNGWRLIKNKPNDYVMELRLCPVVAEVER